MHYTKVFISKDDNKKSLLHDQQFIVKNYQGRSAEL